MSDTLQYSYGRAYGYEELIAAAYRARGYRVTRPKPVKGNGDPGDLIVQTATGTEWIFDVKEAAEWTRPLDRTQPWFPYPTIGLTSPDQLHLDWVYCVVATDMHACAMVIPKEVPEEDRRLYPGINKQTGEEYQFVTIPPSYFLHYLISVSKRGAKP